MGMYDHLECEVDLPDGSPPFGLQTKCFGCRMERYTITKDGDLIYHETEIVECPKEERPYPNDTGLKALCGIWKSIPVGEKRIPFHGYVYFSGFNTPEYPNRAYKAKFTDGKLVEITMNSD